VAALSDGTTMSKSAPKIHFRKHNGYIVCGTKYLKARTTENFSKVTCVTCKDRYPVQREESFEALRNVVRTAALTEQEMTEYLHEQIQLATISQVMQG
jgi:hypothetical protein